MLAGAYRALLVRMSFQIGNSRPLGQDAAQARARSYQLEMLGESMKENIIVAVFSTPLS
jgi:hypothetical protein